MADQKDLEEQIRQLTQSLENLTRSSQGLGRSLEADLQRTLTSGLTKALSNAGRKAEEEAVRQAKALGATEDQQLEIRGRARAAWEGQQAQRSKMATQALSELGATVSKLGGQLYKGMDGLSGFAGATDSAVSSIAKLAVNSNIFVKALAVASMAVVKYGKAAVEQSDKQYKAYKDLSKSGAAASDGLQGVYDMMQQFSLGVDELDKMTGLIAANSQSLAMFKGNVASGARALGKISGEIKDSGLREQFLSMGISMEDQRESAAAYIALQTRIGGVQNRSTKEIAASIGEYVKETDAITKITGATRKEQEAARNRAMAIEQFRYKQEQAAAEGSEEEKKIAKTQLETFNMLSSLGQGGKQVAEGVAAMASGFISEGPGLELSKLIGTKGSEIMNDAALTAAQKTEAIMKEVDTALKGAGGTQAAFGQFGKVFQGLDYSALQDSLKVSGEFSKRLKEATTEQERQTIMNEAATAAQVKGEVANLDTRAAMQGFVQMGVVPATEAMSKFAQATAWATKKLPQTEVGKPADARTTWERMTGAPPKYTGPGEGTPTGTAPGGTTKAAATTSGVPGGAPKTTGAPAAASAELGAGPVFGRPDTTRADKVLVTLEEIREELKKLVKMGAISGGSQTADMTAAMNAHDKSHQHEPPTITPEAAKELGAGVGSPLKNLMVTSGFGMRTDPFTGKQAGHGGVDLAGKIGDAIMAPESGIARVVGEAQSGGYGNMVEILNEQGKVIHRLAHMSETMIKTGDKIAAGTEIGKVGSTGRSTGAHLHWEQFDPTTGKQVDPLAMLAAKQGRGATQVAGRAPGGATDMTTYMRTVAMLESGGNPNVKAVANGVPSSAGGLFGFLESSWKGLGGKNVQDRFDPAKSTEMMAKFSAQQKTQLEKNLGRGVSGADMYLGHFMGAGGATKFLGARDRDPTQSAARLDPAAAASNKSIYYSKEGKERSVEEVYQLMTEKYRKQEANVLAGNIPALVAGITGTGTLAPGGLAGPTGVPAPVAAAPGTVGSLPAAPAAQPAAQPAVAMAAQDNVMLQQLVVLNQQQNTLLGRILQTSQA